MNIWILTETCEQHENAEPRAFATAELAHEAGAAVIGEYRNTSHVADEIDHVLLQFGEQFAARPWDFGAGDSGSYFFVQVRQASIEGA